MKFKLENLPPGVIVCHINEALNQAEAGKFIQGIQKILANGKARIVLNFTLAAAEGEAGADHLEKGLRSFRTLAQKMGGDIKYVVPDPIGQKIYGSLNSLDAAIKSVLGQVADVQVDSEKLLAQIADQAEKLKKQTIENEMLRLKLKELMEIVRQPSTDTELKMAVAHYRQLSIQSEAVPPAAAGSAEEKK